MLFKNLDKEYWSSITKASVVGIHIVSGTFVGLAVGYFLDKWLGTKPWLTMLFLFFGIAAGFRNMIREVKGISGVGNGSKDEEAEEDKSS